MSDHPADDTVFGAAFVARVAFWKILMVMLESLYWPAVYRWSKATREQGRYRREFIDAADSLNEDERGQG